MIVIVRRLCVESGLDCQSVENKLEYGQRQCVEDEYHLLFMCSTNIVKAVMT